MKESRRIIEKLSLLDDLSALVDVMLGTVINEEKDEKGVASGMLQKLSLTNTMQYKDKTGNN
jgi:hypothetical protein